MASSTILITGATGFVGRRLVEALAADPRRLRVVVRDPDRAPRGARVEVVVQDLTAPITPGLCRDVEIAFHLAGYAHAEDDGRGEADERHRAITVEGTRALLADARAHGVSRFVFMSSVKAIGEETGPEAVTGDAPDPQSAYGRARRDAEQLVLSAPGGVVLRAPLVYGPEVKGNLRQMIAAISAGRFPPLPEVDNRRSMVDVRDVVAALRFLADAPDAPGRAWIVTDGEVYSTRRIYESMCAAIGRAVPRWSIPLPLLKAGARAGDLLGRVRKKPAPLTTARLGKLLGHAHYSNQALVALGFRPSRRLEDALPEMVAAWRASQP